jgi:hypothetical protein
MPAKPALIGTSEVAKRLGVAQVTVNVWCLQRRFPNARREETPRGPVWLIPESDLKDFTRPVMGRPIVKKSGKKERHAKQSRKNLTK